MSKCKPNTVSECMCCNLNYDGKCNLDKSSYNQALEDVFEKVREHYKFFKTIPSITFFIEMLDELSKGE